MKTTAHGKDPLFKTVSLFTNPRGRPLVAFGRSPEAAQAKIRKYLKERKEAV